MSAISGIDDAFGEDAELGADWAGVCSGNVDPNDVVAVDEFDDDINRKRGFGVGLDVGSHSIWVGDCAVPRSRADDRTVVFDSHKKDAAFAVCQTSGGFR